MFFIVAPFYGGWSRLKVHNLIVECTVWITEFRLQEWVSTTTKKCFTNLRLTIEAGFVCVCSRRGGCFRKNKARPPFNRDEYLGVMQILTLKIPNHIQLTFKELARMGLQKRLGHHGFTESMGVDSRIRCPKWENISFLPCTVGLAKPLLEKRKVSTKVIIWTRQRSLWNWIFLCSVSEHEFGCT